MFRLAHISDVHLGPLPKVSFSELASKRITGYVNWRRNRSKHLFGEALDTITDAIADMQVDHVAITGDMVNLATNTEIDSVHRWLDERFDPARTSLVPGNHDAYVLGALKKATMLWHPWMLSGETDSPRDKVFPTLVRRGQVALVGISTANPSLPFMATGDFSSAQARKATALLHQAGEEGLFRVILIHHPPVRNAAAWHKRLNGISRFARMIGASGAELILHGHTHLDTLHHLSGPDGPIPVVGIASASQAIGGTKPAAGFNLFEISGRTGAWQIDHRRFSLAGDGPGVAENPVAVIAVPSQPPAA